MVKRVSKWRPNISPTPKTLHVLMQTKYAADVPCKKIPKLSKIDQTSLCQE
jgi:hypothetical protein